MLNLIFSPASSIPNKQLKKLKFRAVPKKWHVLLFVFLTSIMQRKTEIVEKEPERWNPNWQFYFIKFFFIAAENAIDFMIFYFLIYVCQDTHVIDRETGKHLYFVYKKNGEKLGNSFFVYLLWTVRYLQTIHFEYKK